MLRCHTTSVPGHAYTPRFSCRLRMQLARRNVNHHSHRRWTVKKKKEIKKIKKRKNYSTMRPPTATFFNLFKFQRLTILENCKSCSTRYLFPVIGHKRSCGVLTHVCTRKTQQHILHCNEHEQGKGSRSEGCKGLLEV